MQKNWRTEYFKNLIKDKTRTKRWRKVLLCLSCVVVFWTVYALILPAITLESKKCNIEEHTHSAECYSESQELCQTLLGMMRMETKREKILQKNL